MTIKVGIFGATGYTGYELIHILLRHPEAEIVFTTSESSAGSRLSDLYPCPWDLLLIASAEAPLDAIDVAFLCLPHAASMDMVRRVREAGVRAIDLSADFRIPDPATYERWYKTPHTAPELLEEAVYGLVELHREHISKAELIANPGCYPTSVILGLYPLARKGLLGRKIIIDSKSGVSGAGRTPKLTTHFVEVNENLSPYSIGHSHRHIAEMEQELNALNGPYEIIFSPHLLPVNRGILSTIYVEVPSDLTAEQVHEIYRETYAGEPFIHLLPPGQVATLRHTVGSNRCAIGLTRLEGTNSLIVTTSIDNLVKGASGQAVQNMNVMFGLPETMGLGEDRRQGARGEGRSA
ncbi:MAG TPA: N-acetyl-gamma-glutamyl-phosphate reductase [Caldilineae bacterium]|nr:N-acetyl-gamma-glutamyl-phosphate reductase [Caldilineae bacterium]